MRFIRAAREYPMGAGKLQTIALYTSSDHRAMFVREADESFEIGGDSPASYLDYDELERALTAIGPEAVWAGWGFVAEQAGFAELCHRLGIIFIGPPPDVLRRFGNRIEARLQAEAVGVPVVAWSHGPVGSLAEARVEAEALGYPLVVTAAAAVGAEGIKAVAGPDQLEAAFDQVRKEGGATTGDSTVFLEQLVSGAHHVEVQIIADGHGTVWAPGVRDCTVQLRGHKIVEESSSTALDAEDERTAIDAAVALARSVDFRNVGTVEFLYVPERRQLMFHNFTTRLQREHPVTELTTGLDLVKLQIGLARGGRLRGSPPVPRGHAIEVRLNAENPYEGFAPAVGRLEYLRWPSGPGVRVDTGVAQGDVLDPDADTMVAKVLAWGQDRPEALARLGRALAETTVLIPGGTTNKAFHLDLLERPEMAEGSIDTGWLDRMMESGGYPLPQRNDVALIATALDAYDANLSSERKHFFATAARGRPRTTHDAGHVLTLRHGLSRYRVVVARTGPRRYLVTIGSHRIEVESEPIGLYEGRLRVGGRRFRIASIAKGNETLVEVDGMPHRIFEENGGSVRTPTPGVVVDVLVTAGELVGAGAPLVVIESMKMETTVRSPYAGRVLDVLVSPNTQVNLHVPLIRLDEVDSGDPFGAAGDDFGLLDPEGNGPEGTATDRHLADLAGIRTLMLGYDHSRADVRRLIGDYERRHPALAQDSQSTIAAELQILSIFADQCMLSRNRRVGDAGEDEVARNQREYFHAYLRTLDAERAGLPPSFVRRLARVLDHYGVDAVPAGAGPIAGPTDDLEATLFWIYMAQERAPLQIPAVTAVLHRLDRPDDFPTALKPDFLDALDRLIVATQLRYPVIGELARSVRFHCFDQPLTASGRERVMATMRELLATAAVQGQDLDPEVLALLVECPVPLIDLMVELEGDENRRLRQVLIGVQTRRYYQARGLTDVVTAIREGRTVVTGRFETTHGPTRIIAAELSEDELLDGGRSLASLAVGVAEGPTVVDVYVPWVSSPRGALTGLVAAAVDKATWPETVLRVTVSTTISDLGVPGVHRLTFDRHGEALVENTQLRDLHPMIAERLQLWRLSQFELTRMPSAQHVYLFRAVGRDSPTDQRLVGLAEVRDLEPLLDASGAVTALPELERVLSSCVDAIRRARADHPADRKLSNNRVQLYAWPIIDLPIEALIAATRTLAPITDGLGIDEVSLEGRAIGSDGAVHGIVARVSRSLGGKLEITVAEPDIRPLQPLDAYGQKVAEARRRGTTYPLELVPKLVRRAGGPVGTFVELDLDTDGHLVPVDRAPGQNTAALIVGRVSTPTDRHPEGMTRIVLFGDPTKALGSVAEPECARLVAALDLAAALAVPVEWFALSAGAKISMESGSENMDWISRGLRKIIEFTQAGGEVNVVVAGINVGAQPYWNAEATMLMHTKGILIMTPDSAMVLTGKQALEYSGGVAADDNFGIGGYDSVMGPNGQAQYWAPDLDGAIDTLFHHYEYTYVFPGERFPRPLSTGDPTDRDVRLSPQQVEGVDFRTVGEVFDPATNPDRKQPFDIRTVMRAVIDSDHAPLERWAEMGEADTAVVFDAPIGGNPVCLIGIESRALARRGLLPPDGPNQWFAGTLYPRSSKKLARAINAASGNRPLVVLANLSGFDGSPESLRNLQLEYGAEIGRAIVNFDGPIVFCVVSRYHGGAFVVFSVTLNDNMEVVALEGSFASVIGGSPAAAVVFTGEVDARTSSDPRIRELEVRMAAAEGAAASTLRAELDRLRASVRNEKLGEVAEEFERVHSIERARRVGSIRSIIPAGGLRPYLVEAVRRGMERSLGG